MGGLPELLKADKINIDDKYPVIRFTWNELQEFINELNILTGKKYRLPTSKEWKYAAKGGKNSTKSEKKINKIRFYNYLDMLAWEYKIKSHIHKVGSNQPNELGIYDMIGNAQEIANNKNSIAIWGRYFSKEKLLKSNFVIRKENYFFDSIVSASSIDCEKNVIIGLRLVLDTK